MKRLYLVRHAKSSWTDGTLSDHDRPLNKRGIRDAPIMAEKLADLGVLPQAFISSTANRAKSTAEVFYDVLGKDCKQMQLERGLYHASTEGIWAHIFMISNDIQSAIMFGHNPGMTEFANLFGENFIDNVPTCGIMELVTSAEKWEDMNDINTKRTKFLYPKMY